MGCIVGVGRRTAKSRNRRTRRRYACSLRISAALRSLGGTGVEYERRGPVAVITVDRSERRNAIDRETSEALRRAWERYDEDECDLVGALAGSEGTWSAGADLQAMDLAGPDGWLGFVRTRVSRATGAAVVGPCVADGLETGVDERCSAARRA